MNFGHSWVIRCVDLISHTAQWSANDCGHLLVDERWHQWAPIYEMSKQCGSSSTIELCSSFFQRSYFIVLSRRSQLIFFATLSMYQMKEIIFNSPWDNKLWGGKNYIESLHMETHNNDSSLQLPRLSALKIGIQSFPCPLNSEIYLRLRIEHHSLGVNSE